MYARAVSHSYVARQTEVALANLQSRLRDILTGSITDERKQTIMDERQFTRRL